MDKLADLKGRVRSLTAYSFTDGEEVIIFANRTFSNVLDDTFRPCCSCKYMVQNSLFGQKKTLTLNENFKVSFHI
jgi:hypothetical protein